VLNSRIGAKTPTLVAANITKAKKWVVDTMTKYISASLETVSRMLDALTPWCVDLMSRAFTKTNMKTKTSKRTDRRFNSTEEEIRKSG